MNKLIAILNVVAWSGFWAFGYIAVSSDMNDTWQVSIAAILAFVGAGLGIFAYLWLIRHSESTGYAPAPKRSLPRNDSHTDGEKAE